jgi:hypothetical protein
MVETVAEGTLDRLGYGTNLQYGDHIFESHTHSHDVTFLERSQKVCGIYWYQTQLKKNI